MDIAFCRGEGCPLKEKCERFKNHKYACEYVQAWFTDVPYKDGKCDHLLEWDTPVKKTMPQRNTEKT